MEPFQYFPFVPRLDGTKIFLFEAVFFSALASLLVYTSRYNFWLLLYYELGFFYVHLIKLIRGFFWDVFFSWLNMNLDSLMYAYGAKRFKNKTNVLHVWWGINCQLNCLKYNCFLCGFIIHYESILISWIFTHRIFF